MLIEPTAGLTPLLLGALALNVALGGLLAATTYATVERLPVLSAPVAVGVGGALVFAQARLGELLLVVTVPEMKALAVAAAVGGVLGTAAVLVSFEPE